MWRKYTPKAFDVQPIEVVFVIKTAVRMRGVDPDGLEPSTSPM